MNYLDFIIIILLIISAISGYKKGIVSQVTSITALILGIYLAITLTKNLAPWLVDSFSWSIGFSKIFSVITIFILVLVTVGIVGRAIEKTFEDAELGNLNKIFGLVFSIAKTLIILSIITLALSFFGKVKSFPNKDDMHNSMLYMPVASIIPAICPYLEASTNNRTDNKK